MRVFGFDRLFFSPAFTATQYRKVKVYADGNPDFPDQRAGSHGSDPENYISVPGWDAGARLNFRYVLPWGHGRVHIVNRIKTDRGLITSDPVGDRSWNPLKSGRSYVMFMPFFRNQRNEANDEGTSGFRSNGIKLEFKHDNTDFVLNPSTGDIKTVAVTRDWGLFDSTDDWMHVELDYRKFFDLGETHKHRQRVLALNLWCSDVPTWQTTETDTGTEVTRHPPYFNGSTLGGFYRMRAYPVNRFSDRSALYYSAEYRATPQWNPLKGLSILGSPEVEWWQWVLFCEAGRVAEEFNLHTLHTDMNVDAGFGARLYSGGLVGRMDFAFADEGWSAVAMIGQSF